jgi:hypothetical protein
MVTAQTRLRFWSVVGGLILLLSAAPALHAQGAPPMLTNDPDTPGDHHWEINIIGLFEQSPTLHHSEAPTLDLNYGVGERIQLTYEIAWFTDTSPGEPTESGPGDSTVGVKWRFYDAGEHGSKVSLFPQVTFENPGSSSKEKGLVDDGTTVILPFEFSREIGPLILVAEASPILNISRANQWFGGINLAHEFNERFALGAELYCTASKDFSRSELIGNVGAHYILTEHHTLLIAIGRDLHNHFDERSTFIGTIAWQFNL